MSMRPKTPCWNGSRMPVSAKGSKPFINQMGMCLGSTRCSMHGLDLEHRAYRLSRISCSPSRRITALRTPAEAEAGEILPANAEALDRLAQELRRGPMTGTAVRAIVGGAMRWDRRSRSTPHPTP